jgi:hypothetical protein
VITTLVRTVEVRATHLELAQQASLPAWVRLQCLAWAYAERNGHAPFATTELRQYLGLTPARLSQSLATARGLGWIDPTSTARCLVLPGCGINPCEGIHR